MMENDEKMMTVQQKCRFPFAGLSSFNHHLFIIFLHFFIIFHHFPINIAKMMENDEKMKKNDDSPAKVQIFFCWTVII